MSFFKKPTSSSSCVARIRSTSHPGLRPLRLVEKLLAAKVISPLQPEEASPILRMLKLKKPPTIQACKNAPAAPRISSLTVQRPAAVKATRPSLAGKTAPMAKRPPFVVPLHFSTSRAPRPAPRSADPSVHKPRPILSVNKQKSVSPAVSRSSKPRVAPPAQRPQVAASTTKESVFRSHIPVFVDHPSRVHTPAATPRFSTSRIPRLKYTGSPSPSSLSETGSISSFAHQTPCPSPVLVTGVPQVAPKVVGLDTAEDPVVAETRPCVSEVDLAEVIKMKEVVTSLDNAASGPDASTSAPLRRSGNSTKVYPRIRSSPQQPKAEQIAPATDSMGVMDALIGELKTKLAMTKTSTVARPLGTPSLSNGAFASNRSGCVRAGKENLDIPSELQQAFARRRSAISATSRSDVKSALQIPIQERRALASVPHIANRHRLPPSLRNPSQQTASAICPPPPSSSNANCNPPGADCITELVSTVFGTRKVRKLVIPPVLEGSLPSRDPRIIMELNSLRAQQKVGGAGGAEAVL